MKLEYNIIWVDDKIDTAPYKSIKKRLLDFLANEFFNCEILEAEDFNEFKELFSDKRSFDLIITDLSLSEGTTGKEVINFVRDNKHDHTEIFFYSANTQLRQQDLINSNRITFYQLTEGNYNELLKEIIDLVTLTIAKFQHIVSMRGMIMQETSGLDFQMLEIIKQTIANDSIDFNELAVQIYDELGKHYGEKINFVEECKNSKKFKKLTKDNVVFTAEYKIRTLSRILSALDIQDFSEDYKKEINAIRNKFAHAILLKDDNGRDFFKDGESGLTFDEDLCRKIRNDIIKHKKNFDNLQASISA